MAPPPLRDHVGDLVLQPEEDAPEIDVDEQVEIGLVEVLHGRGLARNAGIVEGDVDAAIAA